MSGIKGSWQELYAGKEKIAIAKTIGKTIYIFYSDIKNIEYQFSDNSRYGFLKFNKYDGNSERFIFKKISNREIAKIIDILKKKYENIELKEVSQKFDFNDRFNSLPLRIKVTYFTGIFLVIFISFYVLIESLSGLYVSEISIDQAASEETFSDVEKNDNEEENNTFYDGDVFEGDDITIAHMGCGDYTSDNMFIEPSEGNKFVYIDLSIHNIGDSDFSIGSASFTCYADDTEMSSAIVAAGDEMEIISTLSPDRYLKRKIYFEVPKGTQEIEVEYETSFWTREKIFFVID